MELVYALSVWLYGGLIRIAALFSPKAREWVRGRKDWRASMENALSAVSSRRIWMHCASLGEFEQGRPVLEELKRRFPEHGIVLTFFSPSGYKHRNAAGLADAVLYLPLDGPRASRDFIRMLKPEFAVFVKYEFWYFYSRELFGNRIPAFCISAIFRPGQIFFKPYGGLFRKILERFSSIYVQNEESFQLLSRIALPQVVVSGDTRFDRVAQLPHMPIENPIVNSFCSVSPTLVAGSTWSGDEKVLVDWLRAFPNWNLMIVPHEVSDSNVNRLVTVFGPEAMALSVAVGQSSASSCRVLIVDSVGLLSRLYRFATVSYIGGGFGTGIHNTLEAAVYGKPVVFGPNYQRFKEAHDLIDRGAAHSIGSAAEMISLFKRWQTQPEEIQIAGRAAEAYVASNAGATTTIVQGICAHL